jgi:hypothetical protein
MLSSRGKAPELTMKDGRSPQNSLVGRRPRFPDEAIEVVRREATAAAVGNQQGGDGRDGNWKYRCGSAIEKSPAERVSSKGIMRQLHREGRQHANGVGPRQPRIPENNQALRPHRRPDRPRRDREDWDLRATDARAFGGTLITDLFHLRPLRPCRVHPR